MITKYLWPSCLASIAQSAGDTTSSKTFPFFDLIERLYYGLYFKEAVLKENIRTPTVLELSGGSSFIIHFG